MSTTTPDHRRLGRQLEIFDTDERCGAGLPFWLPAGEVVRDALRPMLCPHHILLYGRRPHPPAELPLRIAEVGAMFRNERSGVVGGLQRVRQMTLNDGHVFCAADQVAGEVAGILAMVHEAYAALQIPPPRLRLSRAGAGPKYVSEPAVWRESEAMLREALQRSGASYDEAEGEAAFYGPKIDLQVSDPQGRESTLSTVQVDLVLPQRFGLGEDGSRPVIVHRSIIGTLERMTAHLLAVHDGALPAWLAPVQVLVLPAGDAARGYAADVVARLHRDGLRAEADARDATLGARTRAAAQRRIPYLAIVGEREQSGQTVSVRLRGGRQLGEPLALDAFAALVSRVVGERARELA